MLLNYIDKPKPQVKSMLNNVLEFVMSVTGKGDF